MMKICESSGASERWVSSSFWPRSEKRSSLLPWFNRFSIQMLKQILIWMQKPWWRENVLIQFFIWKIDMQKLRAVYVTHFMSLTNWKQIHCTISIALTRSKCECECRKIEMNEWKRLIFRLKFMTVPKQKNECICQFWMCCAHCNQNQPSVSMEYLKLHLMLKPSVWHNRTQF